MRHTSGCIGLHFPNRFVHDAIHHVYRVVGAKVHIIARNLVKSIVHHNVHKAVALDKIHVIVVIYFVPAAVLDQPKKIV